jgi:hypothetical protein
VTTPVNEAVWRTAAEANVSHSNPMVSRLAGYLWNAISLICEERRQHAERLAGTEASLDHAHAEVETLKTRAELAEMDTARLDLVLMILQLVGSEGLARKVWDIRSQEVRELIKLYSQTLGSDAQKQFVNDSIHSASLSQIGGKLTQNAIYDNGSAYAYQSPLDVAGGVQASILSTTARGAGSSGSTVIHLDRTATQDLWREGTTQAIQQNPRMVASAAVSGFGQSAGRSKNTTSVLSPSAIQR